MVTVNTVNVTLKIRNDLAANWTTKNPILSSGEIGFENDTLLVKVGDSIHNWGHLPYLNKLDPQFFTKEADGSITLNNEFEELITEVISKENGVITVTIEKDPTAETDAANKRYVDAAVASAGHLKRAIVNELPAIADADSNTIYMILDSSATGADKYREYMIINNEFVQIGDTSVDLNNLVSGNSTAGNLITTNADGALIDSGVAVTKLQNLNIATTSTLGVVKASTADNQINVDPQTGFMTLNRVSTSLLYVPTGDELIIDGGNA